MISVKVNVCVSKRTIYGIVQAPLSHFKFCKGVYHKISLCQLDCDECVFVKYSQNIKGQSTLTAENIIELGAFMTMDTALEDHRVYKIMHLSCRLQYHRYVHIHGVRHNCQELLAEFEADAAKDGCIDLQAT